MFKKTVLLLILLLVSSNAYANIEEHPQFFQNPETLHEGGETIVETEDNSFEDDFFTNLSEKLTEQALQDPRLRLYKFLKRKKVKNPQMYAKIICEEVPDWRQRKVFATILVPESRGDASAVSSKGAIGSWQIMPFWVKILKIKGSLHNPRVNLRYAIKILEIHTQEAKGVLFGRRGGLYRYSGGSGWYSTEIQKLIREIDMV
ncbi:MAG: hypothetical protein ACD_4C00411G0001 [uncultured bacterium (gcode 4)]|uniref:Transglycosylase SLT domain-containing protein n=1 Tax=uncultured bacterium (gcode 4) TaxID=1234023 RepID=K2FWB3_9BACT|nr:MAG: hypothetical protein ACD_4C00411G0001 [uncultured bacterium (gcode 4)]